jgi:hypothetical protein
MHMQMMVVPFTKMFYNFGDSKKYFLLLKETYTEKMYTVFKDQAFRGPVSEQEKRPFNNGFPKTYPKRPSPLWPSYIYSINFSLLANKLLIKSHCKLRREWAIWDKFLERSRSSCSTPLSCLCHSLGQTFPVSKLFHLKSFIKIWVVTHYISCLFIVNLILRLPSVKINLQTQSLFNMLP